MEVSSPSAESENVLCSNLGSTMCSKIVGSSQATITHGQNLVNDDAAIVIETKPIQYDNKYSCNQASSVEMVNTLGPITSAHIKCMYYMLLLWHRKRIYKIPHIKELHFFLFTVEILFSFVFI